MRHNHGLVDKLRSQPFDGPTRGPIVGVACHDDRFVKLSHQGSNGEACLAGVAATAKLSVNSEADVPGEVANMFGVAKAKIQMADVRTVGQEDAKMIEGDEAALRLRAHNFCAPQGNLAERKFRGGRRQRFRRERHFGHGAEPHGNGDRDDCGDYLGGTPKSPLRLRHTEWMWLAGLPSVSDWMLTSSRSNVGP